MPGHARRSIAVATIGAALLVGACSSDDDTTSSTAAPAPAPAAAAAPDTAPADEVLRVLVTNDDGVGAEGIDVVVAALEAMPGVEVTVVAPAENQSGSSDTTSPEPPASTEATTASGHPAMAVDGFPADSVIAALDGGLADDPHLVVSGINEGQNIGPLSDISGTVGAARTAVRGGVPALALSQGFADAPDYASAAALATEWVQEHRAELLAGAAPVVVVSINVPTCPDGPRGVADVPTAAEDGGRNLLEVACDATSDAPIDDVDAFTNGLASRSEVSTDG